MMNSIRTGTIALSMLASMTLAACGGGGGGNSSSTGTVSISLMDRPVDDVTALYVTIVDVTVKPKGDGPAIPLPMKTTPMTVDLLSLTADNAAILVDGAVVDARDYNWVEFGIDDSDITKAYALTQSGGQMPVDIDVPSDRIRLVSGFTVGPNQAVRFLFDWEVNNGLVDAPGRNSYILKPTFRVLQVDEMGSVSGRLTANTATTDPVCNSVADPMIGKVAYIFDGAVTPDDIDANDPNPMTTINARFDVATGDYLFSEVLLPGDYTVAFTCLGDLETDDGDEDLMFLAPLAGSGVISVTADAAVTDIDF